MNPRFLSGIACGIAALLLVLGWSLMLSLSHDRNHKSQIAATKVAAMSQSIDIDHPPASITISKGGTIDLVRYGNSKTKASVTTYATDGKGELLMKLPGGPVGTVATLKALRDGKGIIQIRNEKPGPGGGFTGNGHTISVTVR